MEFKFFLDPIDINVTNHPFKALYSLIDRLEPLTNKKDVNDLLDKYLHGNSLSTNIITGISNDFNKFITLQNRIMELEGQSTSIETVTKVANINLGFVYMVDKIREYSRLSIKTRLHINYDYEACNDNLDKIKSLTTLWTKEMVLRLDGGF